ncbi:AtpZ/AtpI family protein [Candidatus Sumerlaeota bacterium]|nr:AtpZ/AtpI family protein [Candidatus Sumerlaeota bacterium]
MSGENDEEHKEKEKQRKLPVAPEALEALMIPFLLGAGPIVGWYLGNQADQWFGSSPWGQFIGLGFGLGAGVHQAVIIIRRISR